MSARKTALVTGTSEGGLGDAIAQEFHKRGVRVFATARNLKKVVHLEALGIETVVLDVVDTLSIQRAAETVKALTGGKLDFLVNNSGNGYNASLLDTDISAAKKMFDVNVFGLVEVTKIFGPMLVNAHGTVINIGSIGGKAPAPFQGMYNGTKGAVQIISDTLRLELAPLGVKVVHVVTGSIATKFFDNVAPIDFPEDSLYAPVRDEVNGSMQSVFHMATMAPSAYAKDVVDNAMRKHPKAQFWSGDQTWSVWLMATFLPHTAADVILPRMMGLGGLKAKLMRA